MAFNGSLWGRRVLLTGLTPLSSINGFVALISIDNVPVEAIDGGANSAINGGGDLRFSTDDSGINQLPLDDTSFVTSPTPASRVCQLWIRFSNYTSGTRDVYMFYNKAGEIQPSVTDAFGRNSVWQDYGASYHLESDPSGSAPQIIDSKGLNDGTSQGTFIPADSVIGKIGNGVSYDGSNSTNCGSSTVQRGGPNGVTVLCWINAETSAGRRVFFEKRESTEKRGDWGVYTTSNSNLHGRIYNTSNEVDAMLDSSANISLNTDYLLGIRYNDSSGKFDLILDGVQVATKTRPTSITSTSLSIADLRISEGAQAGDFNNFTGENSDSVIYNDVMSDDHLSTLYGNQNSPGTFWITGTPDTPGGIGVIIPVIMNSYRQRRA